MSIGEVNVRELSITLAVSILVGRGIWETFTLVFLSGNSTNSFLLSLTLMLSASSILFFIGRSLKRRTKLGWQTALTATFILATTDIIFASSGYSQPAYEYMLDALLIAFLIVNRSLFLNGDVKSIRGIVSSQ